MTDAIYGRRVIAGSIVEILPCYSSETGTRSIWDEVTACEATVIREAGAELVVVIKGDKYGDENFLCRDRLKWIGGAYR